MKRLFENWRKFITKKELNEYVNAPISSVPISAFGDSNAGGGMNIQPQGKKFADEREDIEEEPSSPQIYCDMDGVLVDLISAVLQKANRDINDENLRRGVEKIISIDWKWTEKNPKYQKSLDYINDMVSNNVEFWATLNPMPDYNRLWSYISQYNPIVLSHPWDNASAEGKRIWVREILQPQPQDVILTGRKHVHATSEDGTPNILIDDFEKYTIPWEAAGGTAILHTSADETIAKLEEMASDWFQK